MSLFLLVLSTSPWELAAVKVVLALLLLPPHSHRHIPARLRWRSTISLDIKKRRGSPKRSSGHRSDGGSELSDAPPPTQTLTRTHPRFSQADTSIRLILRAYMRRTPPLCCCITNAEAFPVTDERIQSDRSHFQAGTQLPRREAVGGWGGGGGGGGRQPRDAKAGKMGAEAKFSPLCVSPYSTLLQAVDRTNISGVPAEAASVPVGGPDRLARREAPEWAAASTTTPSVSLFFAVAAMKPYREEEGRSEGLLAPPTIQASLGTRASFYNSLLLPECG